MKLRLLGTDDELEAERDLPPGDPAALEAALTELPRPDAVGHRVVHGGQRYSTPVVIDDDVLSELRALVELAPLHQSAALDGIAAVSRALPDVPAVACFDTAFHATLPAAASTYALPREWRALGLRRYGFHGLSHAYVARRADAGRVVSCHLGAGASLAAIRDGACVDTTMGFTPMEGLVMATRSGSVDAGLILWLLRHGLDVDAVERGLDRDGGLLGMAGESDMRTLLAREDEDTRLALGVYIHRLRALIAAMAAALGGIDVLAFTGGVGERAPAIRARAAAGLGFLGIALDAGANARATGDAEIGATGAAVRTLVLTAREDLEVARAVRSILTRAMPR